METLASARQIIQQCREHAGEQSHRALQDAVVLAGQFLGFETTFGRYQHDPGATPVHGAWLSRHRLQVATIVCTIRRPTSLQTSWRVAWAKRTLASRKSVSSS